MDGDSGLQDGSVDGARPDASAAHDPTVLPTSGRPKKKRRYGIAFRLNTLAVVASLLGLFSLVVPWVYGVNIPHRQFVVSEDYLPIYDLFMKDDARFLISAVLVAVGSAMVLLFRFGGLVQLAGPLLFLFTLGDYMSNQMADALSEMSLGFFVALIGAVLGVASSFIVSGLPISERMLVFVKAKGGSVVRLNVLSLVGASGGLICFLIPWIVVTMSWSQFYTFEDTSYYHLGDYLLSVHGNLWAITAAAVFLVGSLLSFVTPAGGFGQIAGCLAFMYYAPMDFRNVGGYYSASFSFGIGLYLGAVFGLVVIASIIYTRRFVIRLGAFPWAKVRDLTQAEEAIGSMGEAVPLRLASDRLTAKVATRLSVVAAVILMLFMAPLIVAYSTSVCTLEVRVENDDQLYAGLVEIFLDGESVREMTVNPSSRLGSVLHTTAGQHSVEMDYAFPDSPDGDVLDGKPDWSTWVRVGPLVGNSVVFLFGLHFPGVIFSALSADPDGTGIRFAFDNVSQYILGEETSADFPWGYSSIVLLDGTSGMSWSNISNPALTSIAASPMVWHYGSAKTLSGVGVWLNVTDLGGNGRVDRGDFFVIEPAGAAFAPGVLYEVCVLYKPMDYLVCGAEFGG